MTVNVLTHGADSTGAVSSTAAFTAAIAAMNAGGDDLIVPSGRYLVSNLDFNKPGTYEFAGRNNAILVAEDASSDIVSVTSARVTISGIGFDKSVTRTGGTYLKIAASEVDVESYTMDGAWRGVQICDGIADILLKKGRVRECVSANGIGVQVDGGFALRIEDLIMDAGQQIAAGIKVLSCGDLQILGGHLIHAGNALWLSAASGKTIASVRAIGVDFDNSLRGCLMETTGGAIVRTQFMACWFSSSLDRGILCMTSNGGQINGLDLIAPQIYGNDSDGASWLDSGCKNISVIGGASAGNSGAGLSWGGLSGVRDWLVGFHRSGNVDAWGAPNLYPLWIGGSCNDFNVAHNNLQANTNPIANGAGTGATKIVANNLT
jgi:hypothetical protein